MANKPSRRLTLDSEEVQERFWDKVDYQGWDCWNWKGGIGGKGNGVFGVAGVSYYVHRISYLLTRGDIPEGYEVRRTCHNPLCVRPLHLCLSLKNVARETELPLDPSRYLI